MIARRCLAAGLLACLVGAPMFAQPQAAPPADAQKPAAEPPLRRWFEIQQFAVGTRYRFIENNRDVTTSNQQQYKDSFRARVNLDEQKRYTLNIGYVSGSTFTSSWNNLGLGNNTLFDGKPNYVRQRYAAAIPVKGLEVQSVHLTQALDAAYLVPINRRLDVVISYDVLNTLRRTGIF